MPGSKGAFDDRKIKVTIQLSETEALVFNEDMDIKISGQKDITSLQNECRIDIANMSGEHREYLLSNCNMVFKDAYRKSAHRVIVEIGRESYGLSQIYQGEIVSVSQTQPPDIVVSLKCQTGYRDRGQLIAYGSTSNTSLKTLSEQIADALNLQLEWKATDKQIANFSHSGVAAGLPVMLSKVAGCYAFVDDATLVVLDKGKSRTGKMTLANAESGMVGLPTFTELGIRVKMLAHPNIQLGGEMQVRSSSVQGDYIICSIGYEIASRDTPFYYDCWVFPSA